MITLRNLTLARAGKPLLEKVNLTLHANQKVGVVGANGSGKSSLFALLLDQLHQEAGDLEMPPRLAIAHMAQETPGLPDVALEFVLDGDIELRKIETELAALSDSHDGDKLGLLYEHYEHIGGYTARSRAAAMLHGLGFSDAQLQQTVAEFSGGWRVRLNLARALMCRSDLLLLDEPTNHLDLEAVIWLEGWLRDYRGTLLLISHDREFLDNTATHICHLEQKRLKLYTGNYSDFERQRAAQLALQQAMYEKQQREIAHLKSFIDRFRAKATKARQAQSRIKALGRMDELAAAHVDTPFDFAFREPLSSPDPLLTLEEVDAGYGEKIILRNIKLTLRAGSRSGLLGINGAGKSTLIKLLAGLSAPLAGERYEGKGLKIGYFAQHQLEQLRADESPLQHMIRLDSRTREQELRNFLGGFNFIGDMATAPVGPFSGGEKSRLALALLIWQRPNLLLLDEPTNHLDLEMRHALTMALQEYEGALVLVSHDRHLLRTTCDDFLLVANGRVTPFDGDLEDYRNWLTQNRAEETSASTAASTPSSSRKQQRQQSAEERNRRTEQRRPLQQALAKLEKEIKKLGVEKQQTDAQLADPMLYQEPDKTRLQEHLTRQAQLARQLEQAEARWLALQEELEALAAAE